jgi:hypothetical protein
VCRGVSILVGLRTRKASSITRHLEKATRCIVDAKRA